MHGYDAFEQRYLAEAADAHAVCRLFVDGMLTLERDEALGTQMMLRCCSTRHLDPDASAPSGHRFRMSDREAVKRLLRDPNIARSYAGGHHETGYAGADASRIALDTSYSASAQGVDHPAAGQAKLFVASGGADNPRPITLARNSRGEWKVTGFSSLTTGVRKPAAEVGDF